MGLPGNFFDVLLPYAWRIVRRDVSASVGRRPPAQVSNKREISRLFGDLRDVRRVLGAHL